MLKVCAVVGFLAAALPAVANAEPTACDLLTKGDVGRVRGVSADQTSLRMLNEGTFCGGRCETHGSVCTFTSASSSRYLTLTVMLPPLVSDAKSTVKMMAGNAGLHVSDVEAIGMPGLWVTSYGHGDLYLFGPNLRIYVQQNDLDDDGRALADAKALAAIALDHIREAK